MKNRTILLIDDEHPIRELLRLTLQSAGFISILEAGNGEDGISLACRFLPDLILLDLMLPGIDGLAVCRELKSNPETRKIPLIILTAKSEESDIVLGLEIGANDYITKPFSRKVLIARVRTQLRLQEQLPQADNIIRLSGLFIDNEQRRISLDGKNLSLTYSEFEILLLLASRAERVFTRSQIIRRIKGEDYPVTDRAVDVQIVNLRKKLGDRGTVHIETIRGIGYRLTFDGAAE